jgi:primase-polymerase (primpol)-like protein
LNTCFDTSVTSLYLPIDLPVIHNLSEIDVINEIYKSKQAKLFDDLMKGNYEPYYTSHSEADMAKARSYLSLSHQII